MPKFTGRLLVYGPLVAFCLLFGGALLLLRSGPAVQTAYRAAQDNQKVVELLGPNPALGYNISYTRRGGSKKQVHKLSFPLIGPRGQARIGARLEGADPPVLKRLYLERSTGKQELPVD